MPTQDGLNNFMPCFWTGSLQERVPAPLPPMTSSRRSNFGASDDALLASRRGVGALAQSQVEDEDDGEMSDEDLAPPKASTPVSSAGLPPKFPVEPLGPPPSSQPRTGSAMAIQAMMQKPELASALLACVLTMNRSPTPYSHSSSVTVCATPTPPAEPVADEVASADALHGSSVESVPPAAAPTGTAGAEPPVMTSQIVSPHAVPAAGTASGTAGTTQPAAVASPKPMPPLTRGPSVQDAPTQDQIAAMKQQYAAQMRQYRMSMLSSANHTARAPSTGGPSQISPTQQQQQQQQMLQHQQALAMARMQAINLARQQQAAASGRLLPGMGPPAGWQGMMAASQGMPTMTTTTPSGQQVVYVPVTVSPHAYAAMQSRSSLAPPAVDTASAGTVLPASLKPFGLTPRTTSVAASPLSTQNTPTEADRVAARASPAHGQTEL